MRDALESGYTSIMIDGSHFPFEENIAFTKKAVELCVKAGIPVEGELGRVGGKEDDTASDGAGYTDPEEAVVFVKETGVSSLAIGVGTAHGVYATKPILNPELIGVIKNRLAVPLVLHGASGLDDEIIRQCIQKGISKVNFATELRAAHTAAVREKLRDESIVDPKIYGAYARDRVKEAVKNKISLIFR